MKKTCSLGRRLAAAALAFAMGLGALGLGAGRADVLAANDAPAWASAAVDKMADLGVLRGDRDGQMHANRAVTRAEFISMLNRAFNYTEHSDDALPFTDMTGEEWYADNIRVAYEQGYFSGVSETTAGATRAINREEATSLLCRNLKIDSQELLLDQFTDGRNISRWARPTVGAAVDKGYVSGYNDGSFRPKRNISRAEAAVVLSNSLGTMLTEPGDYTYGTINGNVTVSSSDVVLYDTVIAGDLYITEGVGTGFLGFSNVTVLGEVIVCGGGEGNWGGNSVTFEDCTINTLTADGPEDRPLALNAIGNTAIGSTNVKSTAYLENSPDTEIGFSNIRMDAPEESELHLSGYFDVVEVVGPENGLTLGKGRIGNLIVDEDATDSIVNLDRDTTVDSLRVDSASQINGRGEVGKIYITTPGVTVEMLPNEIEIRPGVITEINGKEMGSLDGAESSDAPRILSGYPKTDELAQNATKMVFSTNKPGTIYWGLSYKEIDEPTEDQLLKPATVAQFKQSGSLNVEESNNEMRIDIGGLETDVQYTLYALLQDDRGDVSVIEDLDFRTPNNTVPAFVSGYPRAEGKTSTSLDIIAMPTKDCAIYWAVMPQGAVAPTVRQMRNEEYDGDIAHGHRNNCKKNKEYSFTVNGLEELVVYDIYVMLTDGVNDSAVSKLTGTTKDTTPPEFTPTTPRQDKVQDTTVDVKVGTTENATVYYVVCERGTDWPVPVPPAVEPPALDSEEAKQAILTANNAMISGTASVRVDQETTVQIRGLQPETPYDLYMALADAAGNVCDIKKIVIKTRDVIPPTAEMYFPDDVEGRPQVENEIHIVFSEEVWNRLTNATMVPDTDDTAENVSLKNLFVLYDRTDDKNDETVAMDFTKVRIESGDLGATIVVFPPEAFINQDGGRGLTSGSRYQFELSNIVDTSGNAMKQKTLLEEFQTTPPLVQLTRTENEESVDKTKIDYLDATFTIEPQSNKTADSVLYDMILESDTTIGFELYYREFGSSANFQPLALSGLCDLDVEGNTPNPSYEPTIMLNAGQSRGAVSLHYIIDRQIEGNTMFHFERFNQLKPGEYGIRIVSIEGDRTRGGWNRTVNMSVKCVAGSRTNLNAIAGNPLPSTVDGAIQAGNVSQVNFPLDFNLMIPFTDTIIPRFLDGYPKLEPPKDGEPIENALIADMLIRPQVMTDRAATLYYLLVPAGTIELNNFNETTQTYPQDELDRIGLDIMNDRLKVENRQWGNVPIESGNTMKEIKIEDLTPETEYDIFFVLKGTPPELSHVWHKRFTTLKIEPPVLTELRVDPDINFGNITITADKSALIQWIIYPEARVKEYLTDDGFGIKDEYVTEVTRLIREDRNTTGALAAVDWSADPGQIAQLRSDGRYRTDMVKTKELDRRYYRVLAIGRTVLSDGVTVVGEDSKILVSNTFTVYDNALPSIFGEKFPVDQEHHIYVTFDKGLYFYKGQGQPGVAVTKDTVDGISTIPTSTHIVPDGCSENGDGVVDVLCIEVPATLTDGYQVTILMSNRITSQAGEGTAQNVVLTYVDNKVGPDGNTFTGFVTNPQDYTTPETPPETTTTASVFSLREQAQQRQTTALQGGVMKPPTVTTGISGVSAVRSGESYSGIVTITFSDNVFYRDGGTIRPISDVATLMQGIDIYGNGVLSDAKQSTFSSYKALPDGAVQSGKTLRSAKLLFSKVEEGDRMVCALNLCDANGNSLNGFTLDFIDMEQRTSNTGSTPASKIRQQSHWELQQ